MDENPSFEARARAALAGLFMLPASAKALILDIAREIDNLKGANDGKSDGGGSGGDAA